MRQLNRKGLMYTNRSNPQVRRIFYFTFLLTFRRLYLAYCAR